MVPVAAPPQACHHTAGAALHITIYDTLLAGAVPHKDPGKPPPPTDTHKLLVAAAPLPLHTRSQLQLAPAVCVDLRSQPRQVSTMITGEGGCTNWWRLLRLISCYLGRVPQVMYITYISIDSTVMGDRVTTSSLASELRAHEGTKQCCACPTSTAQVTRAKPQVQMQLSHTDHVQCRNQHDNLHKPACNSL